MRLSELLQRFSLTTVSPLVEDPTIRGVAPLSGAGPGDLSFLNNPKYRSQVTATRATAVLLKEPVDDCSAVQILCDQPYVTLALVMQALYPEPEVVPGIDPSAVVHADAQVAPGAQIGPLCVVGAGARIGAGSRLVSRVSVGDGATVGSGCVLFPGVVLYAGVTVGDHVRIHANSVVGSDGFGYAQHGGRHIKVPQIGSVVVEDGVEIGAGTCIDRGALDDTVVGAGCIIDNQVQIAHGVKVGRGSILVSQTGISGSAELGPGVVLAGKVGVVGHVKLAGGVQVMGDSVVTKNLDTPGRYAGNPAVPHMTYQKQLAHLRQLPELKKKVSALQRIVDDLSAEKGKSE